MAIEQKAEEYANKAHTHIILNWEKIKQAYIAGATENGIRWHDLRKDPNDLPFVGKKVWIQCEGEVEGDTWLYFKDFPKKTIAWCEITQLQFKED